MQHNPMPDAPWEHLSLDYFGPTHKGQYILVVTDIYSRFPVARFTSNANAETTIKALESILAEYGNVARIDTDNAQIFKSNDWEKYLKTRGIKHRFITPRWPQANRAETVMKGLKKSIQKAEV